MALYVESPATIFVLIIYKIYNIVVIKESLNYKKKGKTHI